MPLRDPSSYLKTEIPESLLHRFERMTMVRNFFQKNELFKDEFLEMEKELLELLPALDEDEQEIENYPDDEYPRDILESLCQEGFRPVVIRGFAKESASVRNWSPSYFKENYGAYRIFYTSTEKIINDDGLTMGEFIDGVLAGNTNRAYIENMSDIFNAHPELHEQLPISKIAALLKDYAYYQNTQIFIGGRGTGASLHAANELNVFINVHGQKRWHFIHPKYSICLYTTLQNQGIFVGSPVKHRAPKRFLEKEFPLYNRIPKQTITLEPGDILLNPPWWWHAIDNLTETTIGIATRWPLIKNYRKQNPILGDFIQSWHPTREKWCEIANNRPNGQTAIPDKYFRKKYNSYESMGFFKR